MKTIQVRNVPEDLSRALKAKAAREGAFLSDFLLAQLEQIAARPTRAELLEQIEARPVRDLPPAEEVLAQERADR